MRVVIAGLLSWVVVFSSTQAWAVAPATQRAVRNVQTAVNSVKLLPELRHGPIPPDKMQTAKNLLSDLDSAISRGEGDLGRIPEADKSDPTVAELSKRLEEFVAFRADLKKSIEGLAAANAANDALFRAFREETKPFASAVSSFQNGAHGAMADVKAAAAQLAKLDELCRTKYPGIKDDPKLSFALSINPGTWCDIAARRDAIAQTSLKNAAAGSFASVLAAVDEAKAKVARNNGFLGESDQPYQLLQDRAGGKAALTAKLKPVMEAAGQTMGPDFFAPLDEKLDAFAAEIDRLAPTWNFEGKHHQANFEAAAKAKFSSIFKGRSPVKTGMLYEAASIDKNALGIPTERYRTGALLAKGPGKWCEYREFTAHETYSGGGTYAAPTFTFGALRLQKCQ